MAEAVVCRCDPDWPAYAKCERCTKEKEAAELHRLLLRRGHVQDNHPARPAFDALVASYSSEDAEPRDVSLLEDFWVNGWHR